MRNLVQDGEWWRYTWRDQNGQSTIHAEYTLNGGGKLFFAVKAEYPEHEAHMEGVVRFATYLPGDPHGAIPEDVDKWSTTGLIGVFRINRDQDVSDDGYGDFFIPYLASVL